MKKSVALIIVILILISCAEKSEKNNSIVRPIYTDYKLGMSIGEATKLYLTNSLTGVYQSKMINDQKMVYETHEVSNGKKYYSSLSFISPPADTMLLGLNIVYSVIDEGDLLAARKSINEGNDMMLSMPEGDYINDGLIVSDLLSKINSSYGKFDSIDSTTTSIDKMDFTYNWLNKNDVNIFLHYISQNLYTQGGKSFYYYHISVKYRYTDEMLKKINYRKSKY